MSEKKRRKSYTPAFKAKIGLEALKGEKTINEIGQEHGVHPAQVGQWKRAIQEQAQSLFEGKRRGPQPAAEHQEPEKLFSEIGKLKMELDWLKKKSGISLPLKRRFWIDREGDIPVVRQCELADVTRSVVYAPVPAAPVSEEELLQCRLIDEEYTRRPFYGSRRMVLFLKAQGHTVNRKRVQRLMRLLGLAGMAPGPNTSRAHPQHRVYPYLLRGVAVTRPNQVWSTDITYVRLERGFAYLVAIIDWYSRKVLSWRLSNTLDAGFCIDCLEDALQRFGVPEIFNSDQGVQFTSEAFTGVLKREGVRISMDGRGRALDNIFVERLWRSVKYEDVYLKGYANMVESTAGLTEYFAFYNDERPHQSLANQTPDQVYQSGQGGGARIGAPGSSPADSSSAW
ncbi:MAG: IS3 family transposase, partial [Xanthomonadaceae bacterium]|nr:IS3 family transposase [Xanthomonadaceae bacterium]